MEASPNANHSTFRSRVYLGQQSPSERSNASFLDLTTLRSLFPAHKQYDVNFATKRRLIEEAAQNDDRLASSLQGSAVAQRPSPVVQRLQHELVSQKRSAADAFMRFNALQKQLADALHMESTLDPNYCPPQHVQIQNNDEDATASSHFDSQEIRKITSLHRELNFADGQQIEASLRGFHNGSMQKAISVRVQEQYPAVAGESDFLETVSAYVGDLNWLPLNRGEVQRVVKALQVGGCVGEGGVGKALVTALVAKMRLGVLAKALGGGSDPLDAVAADDTTATSLRSLPTTTHSLRKLKLPAQRSKAHLRGRYGVRSTPRCLRPGNTAMVHELRRELAAANTAMRNMNNNLQRSVEMASSTCAVTTSRAKLCCQKWGLEKLDSVADRLVFNFYFVGLSRWKRFNQFARNEHKVELYSKSKAARRIGRRLRSWFEYEFLAMWHLWKSVVRCHKAEELEASAVELQAHIRALIGKRTVQRMREMRMSTKIQRIARGFLGRRRAAERREHLRNVWASSVLQQKWKDFQLRRCARRILREKRERHSSTVIQRHYRGRLGRRRFRRLRRHRTETAAAHMIQNLFRGYMVRQRVEIIRQYRMKQGSVVCLQRHVRGRLGRKRAATARRRHSAACCIQQRYREHLTLVAEMRDTRERAAAKIQSVVRGNRDRVIYKAIRFQANVRKDHQDAAISIQAVWRGRTTRIRGKSIRAAFLLRRELSATKIQTMARRNTAAELVSAKRLAVLQEAQSVAEQIAMDKAAVSIQCATRRCQSTEVVAVTKELQAMGCEMRAAAALMETVAASDPHVRQLLDNSTMTVAMARTVKAHWLLLVKVQACIRARRAAKETAPLLIARREELAKIVEQTQDVDSASGPDIDQLASVGYWHAREAFTSALERKHGATVTVMQCVVRLRQAKVRVARRRRDIHAKAERTEQDAAAVRLQSQLRQRKARQEVGRRRVADRVRRAQQQKEAAAAAAKLAAEQNSGRSQLSAPSVDRAAPKAAAVAVRAAPKAAAVDDEEREEYACVVIQAYFRRFHAKKKVRAARKEQLRLKRAAAILEEERSFSAVYIQALMRGAGTRMRMRQILIEQHIKCEEEKKEQRESAARCMQGLVRKRRAKKELRRRQDDKQRAEELLEEEKLFEENLESLKKEQERELHAMRIQSAWRVKKAKTRFAGLREKMNQWNREKEARRRTAAATKLQALARGRRTRTWYWQSYNSLREIVDMYKHCASSWNTLFGMEPEVAPVDPYSLAGAGSSSRAGSAAVSEWVEYWDDSVQAYYWFNSRTQEASWTDPNAGGY